MADDKRRDTRTFGHVIRARRIELGLTQEELAERVGESVRQSDISRMERDHVVLPRRDRLDALAAALEVSPGHLLMHSGWITGEESASMEPASTSIAPEPASLVPPAIATPQDAASAPAAMAVALKGEDSPEAASNLDRAIAHAREVSLETEELLRRTDSTMRNARRSRRASR
jgi:transcriptional regulator with XRE-family HTH domain